MGDLAARGCRASQAPSDRRAPEAVLSQRARYREATASPPPDLPSTHREEVPAARVECPSRSRRARLPRIFAEIPAPRSEPSDLRALLRGTTQDLSSAS